MLYAALLSEDFGPKGASTAVVRTYVGRTLYSVCMVYEDEAKALIGKTISNVELAGAIEPDEVVLVFIDDTRVKFWVGADAEIWMDEA